MCTQQTSVDMISDETIFFNKFIAFKQDYIKLRKLCADIVEEKKILQIKLQILEGRLKLEECDSSSLKVIRQKQEEIIQLLKKKADFTNHENANEVLQQKVHFLETKLESDRSFYEQEIQRILDNTENKITETKTHATNEAEQKIRFVEQKCEELRDKNKELNLLVETIRAENRNEMNRCGEQYHQEINNIIESKLMLERENKMLIDKLFQQEEFFNQKLKVLEKEKKEYYENLKLITRKNSSRQTLNEVFSGKEQSIGSNNCRVNVGMNLEKTTHSPFVTDENIFISKK